jgi:ABC-2 type transport system permease protein
MLAIAGREFAAYFRTPTGWVVLALYLLLSGYAFAATLEPGAPATMRSLFGISHWLLLIVAPAVSMRLLSEELRAGSIEPLMASPIADVSIVLGKYAGAVAFLLAVLAVTLIHVAVLEGVADPEYGPILTGYAGLVLTGGLYLAVGLFFSALTSSQVLAFLLTFCFFFALYVGSSQGAQALPQPWDEAAYRLSIPLRLADFAKGVLDTRHIVFFVAASGFFLVLAALSLESRRWR